jgi:hypothetical protein
MKLLIIFLMFVAFGLFTLSLLWSKRLGNESGPFGPFIGAVLVYMIYEGLIQTQLPEFNIRVDLPIVMFLFVFTLAKIFVASRRRGHEIHAKGPDGTASVSASMTDKNVLDLAEIRANRCLRLGLAGMLFFWFPVPSVVGIVTGHVALHRDIQVAHRKRATIGLVLSYVTIAVYFVTLAA